MTWFKSLIMRQNSPLLLIDSSHHRAGAHSSDDDDSDDNTTSSSSFRDQIDNDDSFVGYRSQSSRRAQVRHRRELVARPEVERRMPVIGENAKHLQRQQQQQQQETTTAATSKILPPPLAVTLSTTTKSCQLSRRQQQKSSANITISSIIIKNSSSTAPATTSQRRSPGLALNSAAHLLPLAAPVNLKIRQRARRRVRPDTMATATSSARALLWLGLVGVALCLLFGADQSGAASGAPQQYFEAQPELQYQVQNGHDVRLRCLVRNRQGECHWLRNGRTVGPIAKKYQFNRTPEDGDCGLVVRNVSVQQDDGQWQCQVTSSEADQEGLQSRESHLIVLVPPERPQIKNLSQGTQRLVLEENKTKFIVCEMRGGNPAPQIDWFLDNKNVSKEAQASSFVGGSGSGAANQRVTQSRLKMSDIKRNMNGKNLTCVGVHQTINQSTVADLDVQYVPTVSVVQHEYSIVEGSPLSISCQVDANPPPNLVNWRLVSDGFTTPATRQQSGITLPTRPGPVLEFERISRELNQNIFECLAQNSYGISLPAEVKLNVLYAPLILNTSLSEIVQVGSQAHLACLFDGNPEPEVKWYYTDPLSRSSAAVQLENNKQQQLTIKNVTYRNEGDYHCEARNQINGVFYAVRSSNIQLDIVGEPQFLVKSPVHSKAIQGSKSDLALTFCSDPAPNKVYWQFGSLRLEVRLPSTNGQQTAGVLALPGGAKQNPMGQRFQANPLQPLHRRDTTFSKAPSCFEASLTILDPELTDQRDYTLVVQNERGHQSAVVRLRVSSPLSPMLMISSAFVTICGLFLLSLVVMFLIKRRHDDSVAGLTNGTGSHHHHHQNGSAANGKNGGGVEHLVNGNGVAAANGQQQQQQTRGLVSGVGQGQANGASNPAGGQLAAAVANEEAKLHGGGGLMSMGASSDTSSGDQKQLLASTGSSDRNSSSASSSASSGSSAATTNQCATDYLANANGLHHHHHGHHSTAGSTPTSLNHISVDDELSHHHLAGSTYQAAESVTRDARLSLRRRGASNDDDDHHHRTLIYANLDYSTAARPAPESANGLQQHSPQHHRRQQTPIAGGRRSPSESSLAGAAAADHQRQSSLRSSPKMTNGGGGGIRSSVGATIAMMNSLAAAAANSSSQSVAGAGAIANGSPSAGVLNGAINQQLANSRQIRKPGPPKPPKPSIQQRSRFYQQQQQQQQQSNTNGLVMIGQPPDYHNHSMSTDGGDPSANELAVEYSRIAFPARAEL